MGYYTAGDIEIHILTENEDFGVLDDGTIYSNASTPSNVLIPALDSGNYATGRLYECTGADPTPDKESKDISTIDQQTKLKIPVREVWNIVISKTKKNLGWDKTYKNLDMGIMNIEMSSITLGTADTTFYFENLAGESAGDTTPVNVIVASGSTLVDDTGTLTEVATDPANATEYVVDYTTGEITTGGATNGDLVATYTYGTRYNGGNLSDHPEADYRIICEFSDDTYGDGYFVGYKGIFTKCKIETDAEGVTNESLTFDGGEFDWVDTVAEATTYKGTIQ